MMLFSLYQFLISEIAKKKIIREIRGEKDFRICAKSWLSPQPNHHEITMYVLL